LPLDVSAKKILWRTAPQVRAAGRDRPVREYLQHRGILQVGVCNNAIAVPLAWSSDNHQSLHGDAAFLRVRAALSCLPDMTYMA
jgi:hypothetical protein